MSGECVSSQPEPTGDPRAGGHAEGVRLQPELEDALRAEIAIGVLRGDALGGDVDGVTTFSTKCFVAGFAFHQRKIGQNFVGPNCFATVNGILHDRKHAGHFETFFSQAI